jgi:1-deoxy-D-xylulose-5-phosphate synthase
LERVLDRVDGPADLKLLSRAQLEQLAAEIREELVRTVTQTGGHLASNLGVVELTLALHRVFDTPTDKIVWDVGHQAYVHKLLTGRKDRFPTMRQHGGLNGFPSRAESEHDAFSTGHASNSISAALGLSLARDLMGGSNAVVAVIGDGAMTGGMAFEALNNAGHLASKLIVVLNDNEMSISPNVGGLAKYLNRLRTDPRYNRAKGEVERALIKMPRGSKLVRLSKRLKNSFKEFVMPTMIWEELGFIYLGPVDGHNIELLEETLSLAQQASRPVFVHVITTKGKGYDPAEHDARHFHGVPPNGGNGGKSHVPSYTSVFANSLVKLAREDKRIVAITAAMPDGTGLGKFAQEFPGRFFDVGIAEQHAVTFAAGLACAGLRPVVAIYSTFLQRAYDQVLLDVCSQDLPVTFALDRSGLVGDDGRTHHGVFDFSYLRHIPGLTVMAPKDENELQQMVATAIQLGRPAAIRYPRGSAVGVPLEETPSLLPVGKAEVLREGRDLAILAVGAMVQPVLAVAESLSQQGVEAAVINARFVKPLDEEMIRMIGSKYGRIVTVEENALAGGFGSAVLEFLERAGLSQIAVRRIGIPDRFVDHGTQLILRDEVGLSPRGILSRIKSFFPDLYLAQRPLALAHD